MKADIFQQAFAHIVKLQNLTYLGLRGNRLNNSAVTMVQKVSVARTFLKTKPKLSLSQMKLKALAHSHKHLYLQMFYALIASNYKKI